jgi:hypothetical protein
MENREAAIAAIRTCKTIDSLNDMLKRFELNDHQEIIDCLNECMYNPIGILIGRDIMSRWNIVWNGPTSTVFISD